MTLSNRDRRNGLILTNSTYRSSQQRSYGKFNKRKAKYNLNDIVLDINNKQDKITSTSNNNFDISNDSFKMSDDEENEEEAAFTNTANILDDDLLMNASSDDDFGDEPYSNAQIINISISDNEDSDIIMESPEKRKPSKSPQKQKNQSQAQVSVHAPPIQQPTSKPLQDITSPKLNSSINTESINEKRVPLAPTSAPNFQRNSSAGLSQFRNRSSINSNNSKRWSLLSFNNDGVDKENITSANNSINKTNKRFSMASTHSTTSMKENNKAKRFSMASTVSTSDIMNSSSNNSVKNKRFSMTSTHSNSSGNSFKNVMNKVGNVLSSVSVSSIEDTTNDSNTTTPYKNIKPGVVGEEKKRFSTSSSILENQSSPLPIRTYSQASISSTNININTSYHNSRDREYANHQTQAQKQTLHAQQPQQMHPQLHSKISQQSLQPAPQLSHQSSYSQLRRKDSDAASMMSTSSIKTSRSRFRLSSIFSSKKGNDTLSNGGNAVFIGDNESIRSIRGKSSLSDMRKSVLSMSPSKHNLFRLARKESIGDLNKKNSSTLDKTMISLPKPDTNSREKLKTRLRNSSSIISINSVISRQPTIQTNNSAGTTSATTATTATTMMTSNEYDHQQLDKLVTLTNYPEVLNFKDYISVVANANNQVLIKFAEASYSEVYLLKNYQTNEILKIFKIIPFGDENFEQPSVDNIIQELTITKKLSSLKSGFIKINEACIVKGSYPRLLLKLWDDFNELKESANYRPEFDQNQKYLIMDLEYGGIDLEKFKITNWKQSLQIFWQIVKSLQIAEEKFKFEHRDLHWGNVVIKEVKNNNDNENTADANQDDLEDVMKDLSIIEEEDNKLTSHLEVKLIDYTLSRLDDDNDRQEGKVIFTRLDHQDFFKGCGDYQFDIYRFMRNQIKSIQKNEAKMNDTNAVNTDDNTIDWSLSSFTNNLYWLHYILDKLLNHKKIKSNDKSDQEFHKNLQYLHKSLDPRKKKLNNDIPIFIKSGTDGKKKIGKRQVVYFQDFQNCSDVLKFGEYYGLKP